MSEEARRLVEEHLGFVIKVASLYRRCGIPFEDLVAEGRLGLVEAARRFDPAKGCQFATYAGWWVRKSILQMISTGGRVVHVPEYQMERRRRAREQGRRDEVHREISLDAPVRQDGRERMADCLRDAGSRDPEQTLLDRERRDRLARALRHLRSHELLVLERRFGLHAEEPETLDMIGRVVGLSRERVRQIEGEGLERLRRLVC